MSQFALVLLLSTVVSAQQPNFDGSRPTLTINVAGYNFASADDAYKASVSKLKEIEAKIATLAKAGFRKSGGNLSIMSGPPNGTYYSEAAQVLKFHFNASANYTLNKVDEAVNLADEIKKSTDSVQLNIFQAEQMSNLNSPIPQNEGEVVGH